MTVRQDDHALLLLRFSGELSTKAKATRRQFVTQLMRNLRDALASEGITGEIERHYDRLFVHLPASEAGAGEEALGRVFGVQSLSRAVRREVGDIEELVDQGEALFGDAVRGRRFAVRARVVGVRRAHAPRRREIEVALGARLRPASAGVDLEAPELTVRLELYGDHAYYFTHTRSGAAGLPLASESRALALVSGGFDSPVAAWHLLRRGVELDYLFCNLGGATHRLGTLRVMQVLARDWSYGTRPRLHAVDFVAVSRHLRERTEPRYWQVILKRLMLRAAEKVARERRARALVTGEAVGQVSSQTLANLATIEEASALPILRPLVGFHKEEIIARAEAIGTASLSAVVGEYCALVPRRPATRARLDTVREQEARMDPAILEAAVATREMIDLRSVDPDDSGMPEIETDVLPEDAVLIDLRSRAEYESWHAPGALHLDFGRALRAYPSFAREQVYVFCCAYGLKSAHLAEMMHKEGLQAWHFRGGTRALRRHLDKEAASRQRRGAD